MSDNRPLSGLFGHKPTFHIEKPENTWQPLRFFNLYRFTLAALFVFLYQASGGTLPSPLGRFDSQIFHTTSLIYLIFSLLVMGLLHRRRPSFKYQCHIHVLGDISFITLLMYTSGGVASGLGILLVISVAYGSMLASGRAPLFYAAIASLAVLIEETFVFLGFTEVKINYPPAGLLGMALFVTAIVAHVMAQRVRESERLAEQRSLDLANMAQLTEYTIQQMRTGVIVIDNDYRVRLINSAAWRLLGSPEVSNHALLTQYCPELQQHLLQWERGKSDPETSLTPSQGPHELLPQFTHIGTGRHGGTLIFLEDAAAATRQAQQLKLASLGRLTASIAHEIRNPLGAISHAAELLAEAPELTTADQRLTHIVTEHTRRINAIIEDVLQLGRRDKSRQEEFELAPWLESFCNEFVHAEGAEREVIHWQCEPGELTLFFDPNHLRQILTNLCQNGLRHAAENANPKVELKAGAQDEHWGYIDIIDHGPGIPDDQRSTIFEPFFTTESSGTGLGLYIARELSTCNQSQLRYEPGEDNISRFRLHFPQQMENVE